MQFDRAIHSLIFIDRNYGALLKTGVRIIRKKGNKMNMYK